MKIYPIIALAPILVVLAGCEQSPEGETAETANVETDETVGNASAAPAMLVAQSALSAADGAARGEARVSETPGGLNVNIRATGLAPGRYGAHVHSVGQCDAPEFKTAEGHWNPTNKQHGFDNSKGSHMGDLPNLTIGADGKGIVDFVIANAQADGPDGLLDGDGAAIVLHAGPDDLTTDPSGDSGARIACGVLRAR